MKTVYIDSLFLLNLAINCLLLLASGRITISETKVKKVLPAAAFGGLWAVASFVPKLGFLSLLPLKLLCVTVMSTITWGLGRGLFKRTGALFAMTALFGGAVWAVYYIIGGKGAPESPGPGAVLAGAAVCFGAVAAWCSRTPLAQKTTVRMTVESGGKITSLTALLDSGNELRDPLTSKPVTVVSRDAFFEILPPEFAPAKALDDPVECFEMLRRLSSGQSFRLISYTALGVEGGMLPALRADAVTVGRRRREGMLVACAPGEISKHGGYTALAGTDV